MALLGPLKNSCHWCMSVCCCYGSIEVNGDNSPLGIVQLGKPQAQAVNVSQ